MARIEHAVAALTEAEARLRSLMGEAAAAGNYDEVDRITGWARAIHALVPTGTNGDVDANRGATGPAPVAAPETRRDDRVRPSAAARGKCRARQGGPRAKRAPAKGEYPKFFRRNDVLVKTGWSKKERAEYVHKAPRRVIDALAAAIRKRSANGRQFTSEELMPLTDPTTGEALPGYQVYVALAWFKSAGLVTQHGRSGYTVKNVSALANAVASSWQTLSDKSMVG